MGHRELRRVPMDFSHPIGEVWPGFLSPEGLSDDELDAWVGTDPPTGEGFQLWETTSEGSPVSPVFETDEALAEWCEANATPFASFKWSRERWLNMFRKDAGGVGTLGAWSASTGLTTLAEVSEKKP